MNSRFKNLIWLVLIIVAFSIFSFVSGGTATYLEFGDDVMTVSAPKNYRYTVNYDDITNVELVDEFNAGTMVSGDENRTYYWGTWENDAWGEYTLCASKKIVNALVITCADGSRLVVNYESAETTGSLLELVTTLLETR